eukprot:TRINITY_DN125_c0_g1_i1.p1 TRINITY_DN125_c0_g1~~TRINITY_DN125_c0_g1_i1.p1  ORF type:complete len:219 (-),score=33.79 TRINITY_DN125_c0_g1_i1:81-737(-)
MAFLLNSVLCLLFVLAIGATTFVDYDSASLYKRQTPTTPNFLPSFNFTDWKTFLQTFSLTLYGSSLGDLDLCLDDEPLFFQYFDQGAKILASSYNFSNVNRGRIAGAITAIGFGLQEVICNLAACLIPESNLENIQFVVNKIRYDLTIQPSTVVPTNDPVLVVSAPNSGSNVVINDVFWKTTSLNSQLRDLALSWTSGDFSGAGDATARFISPIYSNP